MDLFGTAGIRGDVEREVTPDLALRVGQAVAADGDEFVVASDGRRSSPALRSAVTAGLQSGGADVVDAGALPTPALAFASQGRRGVMITASHNPPQDNGIKLFVDGTEYDREGERRVESGVDDGGPAPWDEWGTGSSESPLETYLDAVAEYARQRGPEPEDLTVAVDCGNGMSSVATPQVLGRLGVRVQALEANVDGFFPARGSKPTPETLSALRTFVSRGEADLGVGHDGDADRVVLVDGDGEVVHEDTVVAILAEHYTRESAADDPVVVTTPNASARIDERVRAAGGRVERVRLGALHEGIASVRAEGGDDTAVVFAAEPWKHVHTAFGGWIDGVASAAVLTVLAAEHGLDSLRESVTERPYRKVSVDCPDDAKAGAMERLEQTLPEQFPDASVDTEYGVRLELPDGSWTLVRPSGTEPYVRAYAESEDVDALLETVVDAIERAVDEAS